VWQQLGFKAGEKFYRGEGCEACDGRGRKGWFGVYEMLSITGELRAMISGRKTEAEIFELACREGMVPLLENAKPLVRQKIISIDEAYTISREI
jgi:type II secretory ATPase GspE/PulE/Tfp pilus assembly ATPase PilB-like protein